MQINNDFAEPECSRTYVCKQINLKKKYVESDKRMCTRLRRKEGDNMIWIW